MSFKNPHSSSRKIGVFPTTSSKNGECIWIFSHFFEADPVAKKNKNYVQQQNLHHLPGIPTNS
ncbi:competence protein ComK [Sporosarcina luteola]|uniref:competence protein ComK n=1 Tax=Sporosarcina luteola TaxID=582850 RepID=UPI0033400A01